MCDASCTPANLSRDEAQCATLVGNLRAIAIYGTNASERDRRRLAGLGEVEWVGCEPQAGAADVAVIFGGDGTVHRHLPALVRSQIPLLVVPHGSGNDFARTIGIADRTAAEGVWEGVCRGNGHIRSIDVGLITPVGDHADSTGKSGHVFCCVASVGLDSEINRRANSLPRWLRAHGGYVLSLFPSLPKFAAPNISITVLDSMGRTLSEPAMLAAIANCPSYGHGLKIAPGATVDDGVLDICFVRRLGKLKLLALFPLVFWGKHQRMHEVEYFRAKRLRVETDRPIEVFADGEYVCRTPVEIEIRARALRVIVPKPGAGIRA